jgi:hypothetical protein
VLDDRPTVASAIFRSQRRSPRFLLLHRNGKRARLLDHGNTGASPRRRSYGRE